MRRLLSCISLAALTALPATAQSPPETAAGQVAAADGRPIAAGTLYELRLPGRVVDRAAGCAAGDPCRTLLLLLDATPAAGHGTAEGEAGDSEPSGAGGESGDDPPAARHLLWLSLSGEGAAARAELREPVPWMPAAPNAVAVGDLSGDGRSEVLLGEPGQLWSLGPLDAPLPPAPLARGTHFDLATARRFLSPRATELVTASVGRLALWKAGGSGGLALAAAVSLPVSARRTTYGLELRSPTVSSLLDEDGRHLYLVGPEEVGGGRLRTVVVEPAADGQGRRSWDAWAQLPGAERVEQARFALLSGRPALIVLTHTADRVGVFDQKRLRVLPLIPDRTRAGAAPRLAAETTSHRWQRAEVRIADWNGDGHEDLAVAQVKGLGGKGILLQVYPGGARGFGTKPTKIKIDADLGGWSYPGDLDGDGLPDLLVVDGETVEIYSSRTRQRGRAVGATARWTIDLPAGNERGKSVEGEEKTAVSVGVGSEAAEVGVTGGSPIPVLADLDGDGRTELIFRQPRSRAEDRLLIVRLKE